MVKDFKYIFKRIIIGVGIALALMYLKGNFLLGVKAYDLTSTNLNLPPVTVNSGSAGVDFTITGNPWANWRYGRLYFEFGITKTQGASTDPLLVPRNVYAISDSTAYSCQFGTTSYANSTWTGASYSVTCPMDLGAPGLTRISILFMPFSGGSSSTTTYNVIVGGWATYETVESTQINLDTSTTTSAINNQISNDNTNTQNIINNNNTNTNSIINNNNQNTQQQIESQKVCVNYDKTSIKFEQSFLGDDGVVSTSSRSGVTDYISINSNDNLSVLLPNNTSFANRFCFYNINKTVLSCLNSQNLIGNITIPNNTSYVRFTINIDSDRPQFKICRNGNQAIADSQQQINNTLNDDSGVADNDISDLFGDIESSDTPISDLLTMPITLLNAYISGMSGSCQNISLGRLYGTLLVIPCINVENYLGSDLWGLIDVLLSLFMIYNLSQLFITAFDSITSLKDNFSWLYGVEGKHVGAPSSRVERNSDLY